MTDTATRIEGCVCARHDDGSVTTSVCPRHADSDPCQQMATVTGQRRRGSIVRGVCSNCGWTARTARGRLEDACRLALNVLEGLTTDEFQRGGDRLVRYALVRALHGVGKAYPDEIVEYLS